MGRRPNAIVAEFFERGKKLEDSSNRYQHTCRRCGELFPKGRVDNLLNHLLKRCPNVTDDDRNLILLHLQQPKDKPVFTETPVDRQQSALDTLAEVSRRHLDYSTQQQVLQDADQALAEQALWAQLQQHNIITTQNDYNLQMTEPTLEQQFTTDSQQAELPSLDPQLGSLDLMNDRPDSLNWPPTSFIPKETFRPQPVRVKQRGRFTETRRKQVQEIRKKGACIRCRMLKKPCSEGTPCHTCANVDSARLWKSACVRTRLVDEFTAWSSGYFQAMAKRNTPSGTYSRRLINAINVRLSVDKGPGLKLNAKVFVDHSARSMVARILHDAASTLVIEDSEELLHRIATYLMSASVLNDIVDAEPNHFMRTTLKQAIEIVAQETEQQLVNTMKADRVETRSCYSIVNSLTQDALELWMLTACLVSPSFVIAVGEDGRADQTIMQAQLLAAVEARAVRLSKKVLNDMERRLLQRQQVSGFATFIAAIMLMSSVERMTALYQSLDNTLPDWPIETSARSLWEQGPSFANLLTMLLRMRGLPPRTFENQQGNLEVVLDPTEKLMKLNGSASEGQLRALDEERRTALSAWLTTCSLSAEVVRSWNEDESTSWQGKFIAPLLLQ